MCRILFSVWEEKGKKRIKRERSFLEDRYAEALRQ
jgi:hypothetical protein